jgi:hypothetical protein
MKRLTLLLAFAATAHGQAIAPPTACSSHELVTYGRATADSVIEQGRYFLTATNPVETTAVLASLMAQAGKMVDQYTRCGYPPDYPFAWPTTTPNPTQAAQLSTVTIATFAGDAQGINSTLDKFILPVSGQPFDGAEGLRSAATSAEYLEYVMAQYVLHPEAVSY